MNFPNDNSTQTGIVNVSYTPIYANINNPNILFNDLKSGIYNPSQNTIKMFTNNIDALTQAITQKVVGDQLKKEGTIVTNARHVSSLKKLLLALNDVETGLIQNVTGDLLALDIRQALHYLGTITGEITSEDQLDFIFSKFCIGK